MEDKLKQYYLMMIQKVKTESESEYYYTLYCQLLQNHELVNKSCVKEAYLKEC